MDTRSAEQEITTDPVEFRMRFREITQRATTVRQRPEPEELGPFLTVSRQGGSGGARVARLVGEKLGWTVLDRELITEVAERLELPSDLAAMMDETRSNWVSSILLSLINSRQVAQGSYVENAARVMALTAFDGPVVVVGRGGNLVLPRERGLRLRAVAPREHRIAELARRDELEEEAAAERVDELDRGRRDFIRRHFERDIDDLDLYDLVVDTEAFGVDGAASVVLAALDARGLTAAD